MYVYLFTLGVPKWNAHPKVVLTSSKLYCAILERNRGSTTNFSMSLTFKQARHIKSWQDLMIEESENSLRKRKGIRDWTFRRMYLSVFMLIGAGFMLYCSLFYIGAFIDIGEIVGVSQSSRAQKAQQNVTSMANAKPRTILSPIIDGFSINRIYMRKGQSILATYSLPSNVTLSLSIKQCDAKPILEVFSCTVLGEQTAKVSNRSNGFVEFIVSEPGFYYFEDAVIRLPDTSLKAFYDYRIVWIRGSKQAQKLRPLKNLR